uniref:Arrestin_C domain-containing protein n=1 Tax=Caenorhabditis japonica TaxID=281687 RepID=A0A8R1DZ05_CAEJA
MPFHLAVGLSNCDEQVFEPGGTIEGYVTFDLRESVKVKAIRIAAEGLATTKWLLSESGKSSHGRSREVSYSAKVVYMDEEQLVWKPSEGHAKSSVFPGIHVYPFKFQIPAGVPPSFEGDHGNIRYHVKATVERPWKTNRSVTRYLTVLPKKDLNSVPTASEETSSWKSKSVGFCLFRYGKVNLQIRIPKKGYVPGETIHVETDIENASSRPILKAEFYLIQQCRFLAYRYGISGPDATTSPSSSSSHHAQSDRYLSRKRDETKITSVIQELNVAPRTEHKSRMRLKIPCTCPNFDSTLIHVEYFVVVKLHVKCRIRKTVKAECPVIVGSVPLRGGTEDVSPRTPTYTEVGTFSALTHRSMMSVDEVIKVGTTVSQNIQ